MTHTHSDQRHRFAKHGIIAGLVVLTFAAFLPLWNNQFINFDDPGYVTNNVHVQSGITLRTVQWAFTTTAEANWHPLTWLSHAIDCQLFGLDPRYHHLMSLLLHLMGSIVLFLAMERLTASRWESAFVAIIFAVHPLHVESVAWIAERKDVLSGLFFSLTLWSYAGYRAKPSRTRYLAVMCLYALGLLAKPMLVTLPFLLILLDYWPLQQGQAQNAKPSRRWMSALLVSIREKTPLFLLAFGSSLITYYSQQAGGATKVLADVSLIERIANATISYVTYLRKTILPTDLAIFYPHAKGDINIWQVVFSGFFLLAATFYVWKKRTTQPFLIVGWLWFLGTLVPVIGIVQIGLQGMADRYMYIPQIGLAIMVAWGIPYYVARFHLSRYVIRASFVLVAILLAVGTFIYSREWKDSRSIFEHAIRVTAENYVARNNLGAALADSGKHSEALVSLAEALRIRPDYIPAHRNKARSLAALGRHEEAVSHYRLLLEGGYPDPRLPTIIGTLLAEAGRTVEAQKYFLLAARANPSDVDVQIKLGELYLFGGKLEEARRAGLDALARSPDLSAAYDLLGRVAAEERKEVEAIQHFSEAIRIDSTNINAHRHLGNLYEETGKLSQAAAAYLSVATLDQSDWQIRDRVGAVYAKLGKYPEAEAAWSEALVIFPNSADMRVNLGRVQVINGKMPEADHQFAAALRIDSSHVLAHYHFGKTLLEQARFAEAKDHFTKALRIAPEFHNAKVALQDPRLRKQR